MSISRTVSSIWKMQWQIKFSGKGWTIGVLMHVFLPYPSKNCQELDGFLSRVDVCSL